MQLNLAAMPLAPLKLYDLMALYNLLLFFFLIFIIIIIIIIIIIMSAKNEKIGWHYTKL